MIKRVTKKSFDFNGDLNQRLKSARIKSANPGLMSEKITWRVKA